MKKGLSPIGIFIIILLIMAVGVAVFVILKTNSEKEIKESNDTVSENPNKQGQNCVSFCNPAPKGCHYEYSDERYAEDANYTPTDCLLYPCGALTCDDYLATCKKGEVGEATIKVGETRVIIGLPIQLGFTSRANGDLGGALIVDRGAASSIFENSLPSFSLFKTYDSNYKNIANYSIEELAMTDTSVTVRVFCGEEKYFESIPPGLPPAF